MHAKGKMPLGMPPKGMPKGGEMMTAKERKEAALAMGRHAKKSRKTKLLTSAARKALPPTAFVFPKARKYPIHDISHARNALARVSANGTPAEKAKVMTAVHKKFPSLKK